MVSRVRFPDEPPKINKKHKKIRFLSRFLIRNGSFFVYTGKSLGTTLGANSSFLPLKIFQLCKISGKRRVFAFQKMRVNIFCHSQNGVTEPFFGQKFVNIRQMTHRSERMTCRMNGNALLTFCEKYVKIKKNFIV